MNARRARRTALIVFPALTIAVSVACTPMDARRDVDASVRPESTRQDPMQASSTRAPVTDAQSMSAPTTVPPKSGANVTALQLLGRITVARERPAGYSRALFKHWIDADRDSCNTREEVLISESVTPAQVDPYGCKVIAGDWFSPYDGVTHTDPSDLDIDHVVALKEAWDSGAFSWSASRRQSYANDLTSRASLIAVTAGVNRSKGDKDPTNWMPPRKEYWCTYLTDWVAIKSRWGLSMDQSEHGRIRNVLSTQCSGTSTGTDSSPVAPSPSGTDATGPDTSSNSPTGNSAPNSDSVPATGSVGTVKPGAFCTPVGATGVANGRNYVCSRTNASGEPYAGNRARWRRD